MTKDVSSRIDKMAEWAKKVESRLDALQVYQSAEDGDFDQQIEDLLVKPDYADDILKSRNDIIANEMLLAQINDQLEELEGNAYLEASSEIAENGKALYSNETQRKAAAKALLATNPAYVETMDNKRMIEAAIAKSKADIDYYESLRKETHYQLRAMIVRIENQTARLMTAKGK